MKKILFTLISLLIFANSVFAIEPAKTVYSLINTGDVLGNNG